MELYSGASNSVNTKGKAQAFRPEAVLGVGGITLKVLGPKMSRSCSLSLHPAACKVWTQVCQRSQREKPLIGGSLYPIYRDTEQILGHESCVFFVRLSIPLVWLMKQTQRKPPIFGSPMGMCQHRGTPNGGLSCWIPFQPTSTKIRSEPFGHDFYWRPPSKVVGDGQIPTW